MFTFSQVNFHNPVLSSFAIYDWVRNESISTGSTIGAGTTYRSRAYEFAHCFFFRDRIAKSSVLCVVGGSI